MAMSAIATSSSILYFFILQRSCKNYLYSEGLLLIFLLLLAVSCYCNPIMRDSNVSQDLIVSGNVLPGRQRNKYLQILPLAYSLCIPIAFLCLCLLLNRKLFLASTYIFLKNHLCFFHCCW